MAKSKGIDVSYWNGKLTTTQYKLLKKKGVEFVIARAGGYVGTLEDSTFNNHYKNAKAAGLKFGVYYYSTAISTAQVKKEARHVISLCKGKKLDFPIWMDIEDNDTQGKLSKSKLTAIIKTFVKEVKAAGYKCGIYASYSWLTSKIGDLPGIDIWVAQYNSYCSYKKAKAMWQYSSSGKFSGISCRFDLNWCYKDYGEKPNSDVTKKSYSGTLPKLPVRGYFKRGDKGTQVKYLQKFLNWCGESLYVDGIIGDKTISAVEWYQKKYGLVVDGLFGKKCLEKAKNIKM